MTTITPTKTKLAIITVTTPTKSAAYTTTVPAEVVSLGESGLQVILNQEQARKLVQLWVSLGSDDNLRAWIGEATPLHEFVLGYTDPRFGLNLDPWVCTGGPEWWSTSTFPYAITVDIRDQF